MDAPPPGDFPASPPAAAPDSATASGAGSPPSANHPPLLTPPPVAASPRRDASSPAPRARGSNAWIWFLAVLGVFGLVVCGGVFWFFEQLGDSPIGVLSSPPGRRDNLHESVLEPATTHDKIAVVQVQGVISGDAIDYEGITLVTHIQSQLERAAKDKHVKAVVLKIDSPGGEVLASDEIYKLIADFQEEHDKPVVASMGTIAASGGYYVAAPCRWIVANELTITGSIGVIMHGYNWRGLMEKVGVHPQVFKSGEMKDMLSPDKREEDITTEERRIVQDLVDETFDRFKSVVEEGRGLAQAHNKDNGGDEADQGRHLSKDWTDYADGRLLSGKDAFKLGFVDELGDFNAALGRARKLAGIDDAKVIQYLRPPTFGSLFHLLGKSEVSKVRIDFGVPMPNLRAGLYFIAPLLVR